MSHVGVENRQGRHRIVVREPRREHERIVLQQHREVPDSPAVGDCRQEFLQVTSLDFGHFRQSAITGGLDE